MADPKVKLGELLGASPANRDAVHVAIAPVVAAHELYPGAHVGLVGNDGITVGSYDPAADYYNAAVPTIQLLGIIDPYLREVVQPGERCWLFLYPGSITGLAHVWSHPAFPDVGPPVPVTDHGTGYWEWKPANGNVEKNDAISDSSTNIEASKEWLQHWVLDNDVPSLDEFLDLVIQNEQGGQHGWITFGTDGYGDIPEEVWKHVEIVTGIAMTAKPTSYSCAC